MSLLGRNALGLPRGAVFRAARFDRPTLGIEHTAPFGIGPEHRVLCIGSCFARAVGQMLERAGVESTFAGLTHRYNPLNIAQTLDWALHGGMTDQHFVELQSGRWFDPYDRGALAEGYGDAHEAAAVNAAQLAELRSECAKADRVVMTFGLVEVWRDVREGAWLNQMPPVTTREPFDDRFRLHEASVEECEAAICQSVELIRSVSPNAKVVMSVSPIALNATFTGADVLERTTHGKSVLRVAVERAVRSLGPDVTDYFPSYEIVMWQRGADAYRERDPRGRPDRQHLRDEFVDRAVRPVFERAYLAPAGAPEDVPLPSLGHAASAQDARS